MVNLIRENRMLFHLTLATYTKYELLYIIVATMGYYYENAMIFSYFSVFS